MVINIVFKRIFIELDVSYTSQHAFLKVTVTILQQFSKLVTVTFENVCWQAYETSSSIEMRLNTMFITAVCGIFLIKLRWLKNKSLYDTILKNCFFVKDDLYCLVTSLLQQNHKTTSW